MRQFLLGLSISLAYIAGCLTATHAPTTSVPEARAASARYHCVSLGQAGIAMRDRISAAAFAAKQMNDGAEQGWRFVAFLPDDVGIACFERDA